MHARGKVGNHPPTSNANLLVRIKPSDPPSPIPFAGCVKYIYPTANSAAASPSSSAAQSTDAPCPPLRVAFEKNQASSGHLSKAEE